MIQALIFAGAFATSIYALVDTFTCGSRDAPANHSGN